MDGLDNGCSWWKLRNCEDATVYYSDWTAQDQRNLIRNCPNSCWKCGIERPSDAEEIGTKLKVLPIGNMNIYCVFNLRRKKHWVLFTVLGSSAIHLSRWANCHWGTEFRSESGTGFQIRARIRGRIWNPPRNPGPDSAPDVLATPMPICPSGKIYTRKINFIPPHSIILLTFNIFGYGIFFVKSNPELAYLYKHVLKYKQQQRVSAICEYRDQKKMLKANKILDGEGKWSS